MCDLAWPKIFPSSSLRYVDRICEKPSAAGDAEFIRGDRVRCFTQSRNYSHDVNQRSLFGFGGHTCLGKSISEKVWGLVVERFSQSDIRVQCINMTMSPHNDPFLMPSEAWISLG